MEQNTKCNDYPVKLNNYDNCEFDLSKLEQAYIGMVKANQKKIIRDEKGYPLDTDGKIDWEMASKEKQAVSDKYEAGQKRGKVRHRPTNVTPKKKKRKK